MSARRWAFVTASSRGPSCLASRAAAGCTCLFYTPHAARTPPTRAAAAFRTAHLHSGPIARTKFECAFNAPIIARGNFPTFSDPQNLYGGGWPPPGSADLQLVVVWQAKKAVAEKKAAKEEAEKVPSSPHWTDAVSVALRATRAHALSGNNVFIHTLRCVGPPRVRSRVGVRNGGAMGATVCAFSLL